MVDCQRRKYGTTSYQRPQKKTPPTLCKISGAKEPSYATQLDTSCRDPATIEI
jgi:hypothetical protein